MKTLKSIFHIDMVMQVNTVIFYLKKMWIVGKLIPDSLYGQATAKKVLSVLVAILGQLKRLVGKWLYLMLVVGVPLLMAGKLGGKTSDDAFELMVHIIFILTCVMASLQDSQIFSVTRQKVTCITYMHMSPRSYVRAVFFMNYIPFFVYYLPAVLVFSILWGGSFLQSIGLWLLIVSFRLAGEALQLWIYDKKGYVISRNTAFVWSLMLISLAAAYVPLFMKLEWTLAPILLNPIVVAVSVIIGGLSLYYIIIGYSGYETKYHRSIDLKFLLSEIMGQAKKSTFKEVEVKETDFEYSVEKESKYFKLEGFAYMNALFFGRHHRQLVRPIYYRLVFIGIILAASVFLRIMAPEAAVKASLNIDTLLPAFVFLMYLISVGDKSCRAMFYNCDISLLRYGFYRKPQVILENFKIRLFHVSMYNLSVAGALCFGVIVFCIICGTGFLNINILVFVLAILLLAILFTVHHLFLYYVFQPYTSGLEIKNPFFNVINGGMYMLCFMCTKIKVGGMIFTIGVLAFTICYIAVALALVYRLAPKYFRVK